jgi:uncharacterized damage-inducible protein DinB
MHTTEVWQRGPVPDVDPFLMPAAHSFLQVKEDLERLVVSVPDDLVWRRAGNAAAIGFHVRHIAGSTDRLLTYARGESLTPGQLAAARVETAGDSSLRVLVDEANAALDRALQQIRETGRDALLIERAVGRARLPSTTLGLLMHAAEHATRHMGQAMTTALVLGAGT